MKRSGIINSSRDDGIWDYEKKPKTASFIQGNSR